MSLRIAYMGVGLVPVTSVWWEWESEVHLCANGAVLRPGML